MAYHRNFRRAKPQVRTIVVKYAGKCACCGGEIKAGEMAEYFPVGTIAGRNEAAIGHTGGLDGNGVRCYVELRKQYAADPVDIAYEDQCAEICGR